MIIVSQDKNKIVNFDNIAHIFISKDSEKHYLIEYGKMNGSSELLGIYATEERAKEVLKEILNAKATFALFRIAPAGGREQTEYLIRFTDKKIILDTYEMPKE